MSTLLELGLVNRWTHCMRRVRSGLAGQRSRALKAVAGELKMPMLWWMYCGGYGQRFGV